MLEKEMLRLVGRMRGRARMESVYNSLRGLSVMLCVRGVCLCESLFVYRAMADAGVHREAVSAWSCICMCMARCGCDLCESTCGPH